MKSLLKSISLITVFLFLLVQLSQSQSFEKQNIRVLYVGFDPALPIPEGLQTNMGVTGAASPERFTMEYKNRMPAFKSYLEKYFTTVKTVDARQYELKMSSNYDVTIFDEVIKPWKQRV